MNLDIQKERGTRGGTTCASTLPNKKSSQSPQTTRIIDFSDEDVNEPSIATVLLQSSANRGSSWIINKRTSWPTNEDNNYEDEEHGVEELQKGKYKHIAEDLDGLTSDDQLLMPSSYLSRKSRTRIKSSSESEEGEITLLSKRSSNTINRPTGKTTKKNKNQGPSAPSSNILSATVRPSTRSTSSSAIKGKSKTARTASPPIIELLLSSSSSSESDSVSETESSNSSSSDSLVPSTVKAKRQTRHSMKSAAKSIPIAKKRRTSRSKQVVDSEEEDVEEMEVDHHSQRRSSQRQSSRSNPSSSTFHSSLQKLVNTRQKSSTSSKSAGKLYDNDDRHHDGGKMKHHRHQLSSSQQLLTPTSRHKSKSVASSSANTNSSRRRSQRASNRSSEIRHSVLKKLIKKRHGEEEDDDDDDDEEGGIDEEEEDDIIIFNQNLDDEDNNMIVGYGKGEGEIEEVQEEEEVAVMVRGKRKNKKQQQVFLLPSDEESAKYSSGNDSISDGSINSNGESEPEDDPDDPIVGGSEDDQDDDLDSDIVDEINTQRGQGLYCFVCEEFKHRDNFSVKQQKRWDEEETAFCLLHTGGKYHEMPLINSPSFKVPVDWVFEADGHEEDVAKQLSQRSYKEVQDSDGGYLSEDNEIEKC